MLAMFLVISKLFNWLDPSVVWHFFGHDSVIRRNRNRERGPKSGLTGQWTYKTNCLTPQCGFDHI